MYVVSSETCMCVVVFDEWSLLCPQSQYFCLQFICFIFCFLCCCVYAGMFSMCALLLHHGRTHVIFPRWIVIVMINSCVFKILFILRFSIGKTTFSKSSLSQMYNQHQHQTSIYYSIVLYNYLILKYKK